MTTEVCVSNEHCFPPRRVAWGQLFITVFCMVLSVVSFSTTTRGEAVKNLIILIIFLLLLLLSLLFFLVADPPSRELLPPLGAPCAPSPCSVLWMYPSMLHWTFGVLYLEFAFCLPGLSLWNVCCRGCGWCWYRGLPEWLLCRLVWWQCCTSLFFDMFVSAFA